MITINVTPAKRRFGRKPRKQWQYMVTTDNNKPISDRDTYANIGDISDIWERILDTSEPVQMIIHYQSGPRTILMRTAP